MKNIDMKKVVFTVSSILIILTLTVTLLASFLSYAETKTEKKYNDFSEGWVTEENEPIQLDKLHQSCMIHKEIPALESDSVLSFNSRNLDVDVYIDDVCLYKTEHTKDPVLQAIFGKTAGSAFVEVPILKDYSGKSIYIDVNNPYKNGNACKIVRMYLGNGIQIFKHNSATLLGSFCFGIIIFFLGIVCLILYFPMSKSKIIDESMLYLGVAAFTLGLLMITDCKLLPLIVGCETLYYTISQMFMTLICVPLLLFFSKLYGKLNDKIIIFFSFANIIDFIIVFTLNCFGVFDYHDNAVPVLMIIAGSIIYIAIVTVKEFFIHGNQNLFHNIGVIILAIAVILDLIMTRSDVFFETSFFTMFGIAGFTLMECTQVLWKHIESYQQGLKAQLISRLAYHDGLTDMLNRTSFIEDMEQLEKENNPDMIIAVFDVNNLKYVNDNFGHTDGDELIINAANAITKYFDAFGKCYRIGGDEFVFISHCLDAENNFINAQKKMTEELNKISNDSKYPVSVASGYAVMDSSYHSVKELFDTADEKMYVNKKKMKEQIVLAPKAN